MNEITTGKKETPEEEELARRELEEEIERRKELEDEWKKREQGEFEYSEDIEDEKTKTREKLDDYFEDHGYTSADYETFREDPEWQALYADLKDAMKVQLGEERRVIAYYEAYGFTEGDYALYSQDPEWRAIQRELNPNFELPPLESNAVEIKSHAFDNVPENCRFAVRERLADAPDEVKTWINEYADNIPIRPCERFLNEETLEMEEEACHYNPFTDTIYMQETKAKDSEEYAEVYAHELGHAIDHRLGNLSVEGAFEQAIQRDMLNFEEHPYAKNDMLAELFTNEDAMSDRCVSDILSGAFRNDGRIISEYNSNACAYWNHNNDYWDRPYATEKETFANLFSVYSSGREESVAFLESYFPATTSCFKSIVKMEKGE